MSLLTGILAGLFGGLLGIGGGFVMIPLMGGLLEVGQHRAHGTSLAAMVFVGIVGALSGFLEWPQATRV
ncbi:MAG: TSUP family transporter [Deltaproteobacteria bacterium]|nr:TSUP family transporter [Deltaproteobacteria bacterium]